MCAIDTHAASCPTASATRHDEKLGSRGGTANWPRACFAGTNSVMRSTNEYAAKWGDMQESAILELSPGHLARWRGVPDQGTLDWNRRGRRVMACRRAVDAPHGDL